MKPANPWTPDDTAFVVTLAAWAVALTLLALVVVFALSPTCDQPLPISRACFIGR